MHRYRPSPARVLPVGVPEDSPAPRLSVEAAAVLIQRVYRGCAYRRRFLRVARSDAVEVLLDYERKERGFSELVTYVALSFLFYGVLLLQRDLQHAYELEYFIDRSLMAVTYGEAVSTLASVKSVDDVWDWTESLHDTLYDASTEGEGCNWCLLQAHSVNACALTCRPTGVWSSSAADDDDDDYCSECEARFGTDSTSTVDCFHSRCGFWWDGESVESFVAGAEGDVVGDYDLDRHNWAFGGRADQLSTACEASTVRPTVDFALHVSNISFASDSERGYLGQSARYTSQFFLLQRRAANVSCESGADPSVFPVCYDEEHEYRGQIPTPDGQSRPAFEYRDTAGAYVASVPLGHYNLGANEARCVLDKLRAADWLDRSTTSLELRFMVYNGEHNGLYELCQVMFDFDRGGFVSYQVALTAFPLRDMYTLPSDELRGALELALFLFIVLTIKTQVLEIYESGGFSLETGLALGSAVLLFVNAFVWMHIVKTLRDVELAPVALTLGDEVDLAALDTFDEVSYVSWLLSSYSTGNYLSVFLVVINTFRYMQFHGAISVLTDTITTARFEVLHFLLIFSIIVVCYAFMGWTLFGAQLLQFRTLPTSINTLLLLCLDYFDYSAIGLTSPIVAPAFFWSYFLLVSLLMLNLLLSIIVDAFISVKQQSGRTDTFLVSLRIYAATMLSRARYCLLHRTLAPPPSYVAAFSKTVPRMLSRGECLDLLHRSELPPSVVRRMLKDMLLLRRQRLVQGQDDQFDALDRKLGNLSAALRTVQAGVSSLSSSSGS